MTPAAWEALDEKARRRIREELDVSLIVEASAGTGKTTELVQRIVAVLRQGKAPIERIAAVTFTHKAAGELKLRLREELDKSRRGARGAEAKRIEDALERLEEAAIGTIHSFCAQILRERPVEARIDPAFKEVTEEEAGRLYERAFRRWIEERLAHGSQALDRAFARLAWRDSWETGSPVEQLQFAGWKLTEWRDFPAPWRREPFDDRSAQIDALLDEARELASLSMKCRNPNDNLFRDLSPVRHFRDWIENAERAASRDDNTLEALLVKLSRDLRRSMRKGSGRYGDVSREELLERRDNLLEGLDRFRTRADADLAALLQSEMHSLVERYSEVKRREGGLDFQDLLICARDLVRDQVEVRRHLRRKFTHFFVDEFQDTDPLQAELLLLLAAEDDQADNWLDARPRDGALFLVGDPKQSIYKFRRADVQVYQEIVGKLTGKGVEKVHLTRSFRSISKIQETVNAAFSSAMVESADFGQAAYSPLVQVRKPVEGQPAVIALPLPAPFDGRGRVTKTSVNRQLPETVCAFVDWLCRKSGWKVEEPDQKLVPIRPGHIAILFRRFLNAGDDLTRPYVKGLEARNLPHLLVGSKSYHQREEVETLRCALTAIEWPDDELSVYATLRGSLFAIPDRDLFAFRAEYGRLNPYRKYPEPLPAPYQPVAAALAAICDLHRERNRRPVAGTVSRLLEETRAHAAFVSRPGGQQVLANVRRVADLARNYEIAGGISFRGFVEVLAEEAEKARSQEAPVHEEGSDGVRLMSVHGAKGLEFPVVILADITASISQQDPDRYIDPVSRLCATRILRCAPLELSQHETEERLREREEGLRVAYVAATRARDLLVVPAVSDQPTDWWLSPLNPALYPSPGEARAAKPAPGCPKFGDSTMTSQPSVIQPGLHRSQADTEVVWWDSNLLELRVEEKESLNPAEVFADTPLGRRSEESYMQWKDSRERQIEQGRMPAIEITLATQAASPPPDAVAVEQATARAAGERPGGVRFGRLLHGVLRDAQLDADRGSLEKFARLHGRLAGATEEEIDAATVAVAAVLAHPLLEAARSAAVCHREWPVAARMGERQMLEGVIDLLYREADGWRIVDFKTDADLADRLPQYERQLQWYAWAVSRITGLPVRATLLAV